MINVNIFPIGKLQTNCYLLSRAGRAVVIDPGDEPGILLTFLTNAGLSLERILNTHMHFDHIVGNAALSRVTGAFIQASEADNFLLDLWVGRGGTMGMPVVDDFSFNSLSPGYMDLLGYPCQVLSTPGHSPGSLTFYVMDLGIAFVGDVIFQRAIGRTDLPGGDIQTLQRSAIDVLFRLPSETRIYPGHGPITTVGDEKNSNFFPKNISV